MKHLYFVRHGLSEFNKSNTWAGSSDTPLAPEGHDQAKKTGQKIYKQGLVFDVIVSSPLQRAHDTAKHIAEEIGYPPEQIILQKLLIERSFGELEGRKDLRAVTNYMLGEERIDKYKNVEKLEDLHIRAQKVLDYLNTLPHETVLVVGHGASGRALRRVINNEPHNHWGKRYDNAELVQFI